MKVNTKTRENKHVASSERSDAATEVSKVSITVVGVFATIVGLWSLACIVGGVMSSGGVTQLLSAWFTAVSGN
jgi:di/tricarboxylate transporter